MSRSPLDALIAAEREAPPRPPRAAAKQTWRRVEKSLAVSAAAQFDLPPSQVAAAGGAAPVLGGVGKLVLATVLAGGGVTTAVVVSQSDDGGVHETVQAGQGGGPGRQATPARVEPAKRAAEVPVSAVPPEVPAAEALTPAAPVVIDPPPHASAVESRASRGAPPQRPKHVGLAQEIELIKRARQAVNRHAYGEALKILAQHKRSYPRGAFVEDRAALHAIAVCQSGKSAADTRAAASFASKFSGSVHADRVVEACSVVGRKKVEKVE